MRRVDMDLKKLRTEGTAQMDVVWVYGWPVCIIKNAIAFEILRGATNREFFDV